jgi:hypothetical protein
MVRIPSLTTFGLVERNEADRMGDRNPRTYRAAEQRVHGDAELDRSQIVGGHIDCRLGIRVAFDSLIHACVNFDDVRGLRALNCGGEIGLDDRSRDKHAFSEIAAVLSGPIL